MKKQYDITDPERDVMVARVEQYSGLTFPKDWTDNEWRLLRNLINRVIVAFRLGDKDVELLKEMCEKQDLNIDKEAA